MYCQEHYLSSKLCSFLGGLVEGFRVFCWHCSSFFPSSSFFRCCGAKRALFPKNSL